MLANWSEIILEFTPLRRHLVFPFRKLELCVRSEFRRRESFSYVAGPSKGILTLEGIM